MSQNNIDMEQHHLLISSTYSEVSLGGGGVWVSSSNTCFGASEFWYNLPKEQVHYQLLSLPCFSVDVFWSELQLVSCTKWVVLSLPEYPIIPNSFLFTKKVVIWRYSIYFSLFTWITFLFFWSHIWPLLQNHTDALGKVWSLGNVLLQSHAVNIAHKHPLLSEKMFNDRRCYVNGRASRILINY